MNIIADENIAIIKEQPALFWFVWPDYPHNKKRK
jgi:hypothetical protein